MEFNRVLGRNLKEEFVGVLDGLCPSLMEIFKRKTGRIGKQLADLVQQTTSTEPTTIRCLVLRGLPVILGDDASMFFKSSSTFTWPRPVFGTTSLDDVLSSHLLKGMQNDSLNSSSQR
ncbi:hypothetical protein GBF38_011374 [Nibea albiflora]|uniref:Uncharacterized protein n=1 Tax=Nibea albiflora TaxID=240163 RepID=A0ACB7EU30_NIBAL|nr:hypothetical protein GBF38_011374 [Nibea albiflora]